MSVCLSVYVSVYVSVCLFAGKVTAVSVTADGLLLCTAAEDKALKVFDVINFGMYMYTQKS